MLIVLRILLFLPDPASSMITVASGHYLSLSFTIHPKGSLHVRWFGGSDEVRDNSADI